MYVELRIRGGRLDNPSTNALECIEFVFVSPESIITELVLKFEADGCSTLI